MIIEKSYKFYAAHRNQHLPGSKCERLHGHRYGLVIGFEVTRGGAKNQASGATVLFEDLDSIVAGMIECLDHHTLIDAHDNDLTSRLPTGHYWELPFPTSAENLAFALFTYIRIMLASQSRIAYLRLQETDSAVIVYSAEDWLRDSAWFGETVLSDLRGDTEVM